MQTALDGSTLMSNERVLVCCKCGELLRDPVQLSCLHNCCQLCLDNEAATGSMTCVLCEEADVQEKGRNLFVASHIRFLEILKGCVRCEPCFKDDCDEHVDADDLCRSCQKFMCSECCRLHDKLNENHATIPIEEIRSSGNIATTCFLPCSTHERDYEHVCFSCETPMCAACAGSCVTRSHDVEQIGSSRTEGYVSKIKRNIDELLLPLGCVSNALKCQQEVILELRSLRKMRLDIMRYNKKMVMEALDRAYLTAESALQEACDELDRKAMELLTNTERLNRRVDYAQLYLHCLVNSEDIVSLLQQQKTLQSRLQQLAEELHKLEPQIGEERTVNYIKFKDGKLPEDLDQLVAAWIGMPELVQGKNVVASRQDPEMASANAKQHENSEVDGQAESSDLVSTNRPPRLPATADSPSIAHSESPGHHSQRMSREERDFELQCGGCRALVTTSSDLRIVVLGSRKEGRTSRHYVVIDPSFLDRIKVHKHWTPFDIGETTVFRHTVKKEKKISCKNCDMDWGAGVRFSEKYFFFIKLETLVIVAEGCDDKRLTKWKYLPYLLKFIKDHELLEFGAEEIPPDYELPPRWFVEVPE